MNTSKLVLRNFFLLSLFISVFACSKDEEATNSQVGDTPWNRQFLYGNTVINGQDVLTHEVSTTANHIEDYVCYSDLPTGPFQTFSFNVFVPKHLTEGFQSGNIPNGMHVFYNGQSSPDIGFENIFVRTETINGVLYSKFLLGGRYEGTDITKDNFQQFRFDFDMAYKNSDGDIVQSDAKAITINIKDCGQGGNNGNGDGNNDGNGVGDVKFWLNSDLGCGFVEVIIEGIGSSTITGFFPSAPDCGNSNAGGNFSDLPVGNYTFTASCQGMNWEGNFSIEEGGCLRFELN